MFCIHCGQKIDAGSKFCPYCGERLEDETKTAATQSDAVFQPTETQTTAQTAATQMVAQTATPSQTVTQTAATQTDVPMEQPEPREAARKKSRKPWLIAGSITGGVVILAGAAFGVTRYMGQNDLTHAKTAAASGDYQTALSQAQAAKRLEPYSSVVPGDIQLYQLANQVAKQNNVAATSLKKRDYQGAMQAFAVSQKLLLKQTNPLFDKLKTAVQTGTSQSKIGAIEQNAMKSSDVSAVASFLSQLNGYPVDLRKQAQTTVTSRLESLVSYQVEQDIQNDNFDSASSLVKTALQANANDSKISSLTDTIASAKQAYEAKQQQIEEQSLAQAAQITNQNQHPVVFQNINVSLDAYGDTVASGQVYNQASQAIGDIQLTVVFYDSNGNVVDTEYTYVDPVSLNPGDTGGYYIAIPSYYNATSAQVTYYTWLNE